VICEPYALINLLSTVWIKWTLFIVWILWLHY